MKIKNKLTYTLAPSSVERLSLAEYCPTPDEYLTRCGNHSQPLGFAASFYQFL